MEALPLKNAFKILGNVTVIFVKRLNGEIIETRIDTAMLPIVEGFPNTWQATWKKATQSYYIRGSVTDHAHHRRRRQIWLHRLVMNAVDPTLEVDHRDHDTLNNTLNNLQVVTKSGNMQNRKGPTRSSRSGLRNVHWHAPSKKWMAEFRHQGRKYNIGYFTDPEEAAIAVQDAKARLGLIAYSPKAVGAIS